MRLPISSQPVMRGSAARTALIASLAAAGCSVSGTSPYCKGSCGDCSPGETCYGPFNCDPNTGNCCSSGSKYLCCS